MTDTFVLVTGSENITFQGVYAGNIIATNNGTLPVKDGMIIERSLSEGQTQSYTVVKATYYEGFDTSGMGMGPQVGRGHFQIKVK